MAVKLHLIIDQGTDYSTNIAYTYANGSNVDVTDYSGSAVLKKAYSSSNSYNLNVSLANGVVTVGLTSAQSANIPAGRYVWDCEITDANSDVSRFREGIITIKPQVT